MLKRMSGLMSVLAAAIGMSAAMTPAAHPPVQGYGSGGWGGRSRTPGSRRPAGSKLARMAEQRRIGVTGGSSKRGAYGNWGRTPREQARIRNRALRAAGF